MKPWLDSSVPQGKNGVATILKFVMQIVLPVIYLAIHNHLIAEMEDENVGVRVLVRNSAWGRCRDH